MKYSNYIINGILGVAVIVLFILHFTGKRAGTNPSGTADAGEFSADSRLPIAYIRTDSLLPNYKFFTDLSDAMMKKVDEKRVLFKKREDKLQKDYNDFVQRVQNNNFITQERAQQEQNRLIGQKDQLEADVRQFEYDMSIEQANLQQELSETIVSALKDFNTPKKYEFIFANAGTDNILYAEDCYDITTEVTEFLNERYVPAK